MAAERDAIDAEPHTAPHEAKPVHVDPVYMPAANEVIKVLIVVKPTYRGHREPPGA